MFFLGKGDAAAAVSDDDGFGTRTRTKAMMKNKMKDDRLRPKAPKQRSLFVLSGFFVWQLVPVGGASNPWKYQMLILEIKLHGHFVSVSIVIKSECMPGAGGLVDGSANIATKNEWFSKQRTVISISNAMTNNFFSKSSFKNK